MPPGTRARTPRLDASPRHQKQRADSPRRRYAEIYLGGTHSKCFLFLAVRSSAIVVE